MNCFCGCGGQPVGRRARFLPGHDAKLKKALNEAYHRDPNAVVFDPFAGEPATIRPFDLATKLDEGTGLSSWRDAVCRPATRAAREARAKKRVDDLMERLEHTGKLMRP